MGEFRHAFRRLCRTPGFTLVAVVTIALGIGANVAVFSILNALVLRDLPVAHAKDLVSITPVLRNGAREGLSSPAFADLRRDSAGFASWMACACDGIASVELNGETTRHDVSDVTGNFFSELGVRPLLGRLLTSTDVELVSFAPSHVAVVSYAFWQQRLAGEPAIIGRTITIDAQPYTLIGVTPRDFRGLSRTVQSDVFLPLTALGQAETDVEGAIGALQVFGRLKPGVSLMQARAEVETRWPRMLAATMPDTFTGVRRDNYLAIKPVVAEATTYIDHLGQVKYINALVIVSGIAGLMLIIACVNLAGLMLARMSARAHDMGIQLALGASRWRVARPVLVEGLLLSTVGSLAGLMTGPLVSAVVSRMMIGGGPYSPALDVHPDAIVLVGCLAVTVAVGLAFSGAPAWQAIRRDTLSSLRDRDRGVTRGRRLGRGLVIAQVALSVMLVTNAALLTRALELLRETPGGFDSTDVTIAAFERHPGGPPLGAPDLRAIIDDIAAVPGVQSAGLSYGEPEGGWPFADLAAAASAPGDEVQSERDVTTPGFFQTLGMPVLQGRDFAWTDGPTSNVVIISRSLATRLYGTQPALGERLRMGTQNQDLLVVGIVADVRLHDVKNSNPYAIYTPLLQERFGPSNLFYDGAFLLVKGRVAAADLRLTMARRGLEFRIEPTTLASVKDQALVRERLIGAIAKFFGALTLLLAGIGVHGLMVSAVSARTRELGIRQALGATRTRILASVLLESTATTLLGIAIGIGSAFFTVRLVRTLLFGLSAHDPLTWLAVSSVLLASALGASIVPAVRAARVNVMQALRAE